MEKWLTYDEVVWINTKLCEDSGGLIGVTKPAAIDAALARPFSGFGDVELFPTAFGKAASLAHSIVTTHPFLDGNKRTGFACADVVLLMWGLSIKDCPEGESMFFAVASGTVTVEELTVWLEVNSEPATQDQ